MPPNVPPIAPPITKKILLSDLSHRSQNTCSMIISCNNIAVAVSYS